MNITLIGMPGAGKSFVGEQLAYQLNYQFIDTDELIRKFTGLSLFESIEKVGEENFIRIEEQVILGLGDFERCVVSPGGSIIYSPQAIDFMQKRSVVVFVDVPIEVILQRVEPQRGVVRLRDRSLQELFMERQPLYKRYSEHTVSGDLDVRLVVEEIRRVVGL